jgi:hypothetical protein
MELRECFWVAILLTEFVGLRVLAFKMKNVDGQANVVKERVALGKFGESAVVVEKYMVRLDRVLARIDLFNELL